MSDSKYPKVEKHKVRGAVFHIVEMSKGKFHINRHGKLEEVYEFPEGDKKESLKPLNRSDNAESLKKQLELFFR